MLPIKSWNPWACLKNFYSCTPWRWGLCFCCLMPEVAVLPDYDFCHTFRVSGKKQKWFFFQNGKTWIFKKCHLETYTKFFPPGKVLTMEWEGISCQNLQCKTISLVFLVKIIIEKSRSKRFLWNRNWDLGWIWAGLATFEACFHCRRWKYFWHKMNLIFFS